VRTFNGYHFTGIIPARYASSRFPGKPLIDLGGKSMIQRVYEQSSGVLDEVFVATDDKRIYDSVVSFSGKVVMTSDKHMSGTDRCAEAVQIISKEYGVQTNVVINIQGDEPFIKPEQINLLISCFTDKSVEIATLVRKVQPGENIIDPNNPKVILDVNGNAIYFSRNVIPYIRNAKNEEWTSFHTYYKHIGLYAYKTETLSSITSLTVSSLEKAESLEQNRWIENGYRIRTAVTEWESLCIDTPEDVEKAKKFFIRFK
jgi:3-deoxy-manno-octulosonate cytidylyltransferase (CMP-KDO synthetase)